MSVVGPRMVMFVVLLCSCFRLPSSPLFRFITVLMIICVALRYFRDTVGDPFADRIYNYSSDHSKVVPLLQIVFVRASMVLYATLGPRL